MVKHPKKLTVRSAWVRIMALPILLLCAYCIDVTSFDPLSSGFGPTPVVLSPTAEVVHGVNRIILCQYTFLYNKSVSRTTP